MSIDDEYRVHKVVFNNDIQTLKKLFSNEELSKKDKHGNTPLHIAVGLGHKECINYLIDKDVPVKIKNNQGWSTLAEAISYGDRQTIITLLATLKKQARNTMKNRRPSLIKALNDIGNFYMEIKWDFTSWLPFVSRSLPSDVSKIYKKGCNIRLDSTLSGFDDFKWQDGDISFLFLGDYKIGRSLIFMDNKEKYYQKIKKDLKSNLEDEVDILMSNDIVALQLNTKEIAFTRAHSGWLFKEKRTEMIGNFLADFYQISGLCLESKKRREHLTEQDLTNDNLSFPIGFKNNEKSNSKTELLNESNNLDKSNNISNSNSTSDTINSDSFNNESKHENSRRKSLPKPQKQNITWEEYINSDTDKLPCLGRKMVCKQSVKKFKATIGMSQNFPLTISSLLNILEVLAPFKHFNKLREFIEVKLPPGFPIEIDIPILPTITAHITFQEFRFDDNLDDSLFKVPDDYEKIKSDTF